MTTRAIHTRITKGLAFRSRHALDAAIAKVRGNGISAYWYSESVNFGDLITPVLLRHFGYSPILSRPMRAQLVSTGSILEHLQNDYEGIILGSGFIDERSRMSFPAARVLAVRGALTRARMGRGSDLALGDPGLLASIVMPDRETKKYALGIIPHHSEKSHPVFRRLAERNLNRVTVIDVEQKPLKVFRQIDQCDTLCHRLCMG